MNDDLLLTNKAFTVFRKRRPINLEFQDLTYTVADGGKSSKLILKGVSGKFSSGQLTAILGPSGAGKTSLLHILAGYKHAGTAGNIFVNGLSRNVEKFKKISRYIMQQDYVQPYLTVQESMKIAADLKLGSQEIKKNKEIMINESLDFLGLNHCKDTLAKCLSGGEKKRFSIALELINNPAVIFLDEPTTGLDDVACFQCIGLLQLLAKGGRTVVCVVHTPSAKLFSAFDNAYFINQGQCVYQGYGPSVLSYLTRIGLVCPMSYSPADFMMEVCCKEYGDFQNKMVSIIENGRSTEYLRGQLPKADDAIISDEMDLIKGDKTKYVKMKDIKTSFFQQFIILMSRAWIQIWRDKTTLTIKICVWIFIALIIGNIYIGMGNDGSKTLFNFGFFYNCLMFFMYIPLMPVLLSFPLEVKVLKREYFNRWYDLAPYYLALTIVSIPVQLVLAVLYMGITYTISDQPMELERIVMFYIICVLTILVSESFGMLVGSFFNIVNALFLGTCMKIPIMLLATYGYGSGTETIPGWIRISMYFSYLRYSMEGLMTTMLRNRPIIPCPEDEQWCIYTDVSFFLKSMGMEGAVLWIDVTALIVFFVVFKALGFYFLKQRLSPNRLSRSMQGVFKLLKANLGP